jgi:hypothetical protein
MSLLGEVEDDSSGRFLRARHRPRIDGLRADGFTQGLARLEVRHAPLGDVHALAGARVAAQARRPAIDREAAEAADLDAVSTDQCVAHRVQNGLDGCIGVALRQLAEALGQQFDEIGTGHVTDITSFRSDAASRSFSGHPWSGLGPATGCAP